MKHYKTPNNEIYAYDDDIDEAFLNVKINELSLTLLSSDELNRPKEPILNELKQLKLNELDIWFESMKNHSKVSLINFGVIDGGYKYLLNARAIKNSFNLLPQKLFRMWDNSFKEITFQDIQNIERAIELAGIKLHNIKWSYEEAISNSKDELELISFSDVIDVEL